MAGDPEGPDAAVAEEVDHAVEAGGGVWGEGPLVERRLALEQAVARSLDEEVLERAIAGIAGAAVPNPQLAELMPDRPPAFTSDHFLVQLAAAEAGLGAIVLPRLRRRSIRPSALVPLRVDLGPFSRGLVHLVCARSALDIPRVRTVAELLVEELQRAASPGR